jgi:hypothetical protein
MILFACESGGGGDDPVSAPTTPGIKTFSGKIEKGALQQGATITASEWSVSGGYSGKVYTTETINNLGGYTLSSSDLQGILDVRADGFFINENTGTVENTRIILSGLVDSSVSGEGNINIITHIIKQRVINLMNAGADFSTANNQAVTELYSTVTWTPENPLNTSISQNAKLLFLSSAICKNRTVAEVSDILTTLVADMADGNVNISILDASFSLVDPATVSTNMNSLYSSSPDIATVKTQVIAYREIDDETVRQITMIPVSSAGFYLYGNGQLKGLVGSEVSTMNISYVQRYLGVTETINTIISEFFSIVNDGVKTLYFRVTFPYDSSIKYFQQVNNVVSEVPFLPSKPTKTRIEPFIETDSFGIKYVSSYDNCIEPGQETLYNQRIELYESNGDYLHQGWTHNMINIGGTWISQEVWIEGYHIFDEFIYSGTNYGNGILVKWSNGTLMFLYADPDFIIEGNTDVEYLNLGNSLVMW